MISRTKIKIPFDVPMIFALETINGEQCSSKFAGTEYRYQVQHEGRPGLIYLSPQGRDEVVRARPAPGELVEVLKRKHGDESVYSVRLVSDAQEPPPPQTARVVRMADKSNGSSNGYVNGAAAPAQPQIPASHPIEDLLSRLFVAAAHSLGRAHRQLAKEGFNLEPPIWEDVRAVGISLFIEHNRREVQR